MYRASHDEEVLPTFEPLLQLSTGLVPETAAVKDDSGLPWGAVVQPYSPLRAVIRDKEELVRIRRARGLASTALARCESCFAYINRFTTRLRSSWVCSICANRSSFANEAESRRYGTLTRKGALPELTHELFECEVSRAPIDMGAPGTGKKRAANAPTVAYVAVVDTAGTEQQVAALRLALLRAVDNLSPAASFGLVTISSRLGVYNLRKRRPCVQHIRVPPAASAAAGATVPSDAEEDAASLGIADIVRGGEFCVPVHAYRDHICAALSSIRSCPGPRGTGFAVLEVVSTLSTQFKTGRLAGARVMLFMTGRPDYGEGMVSPPPKPRTVTTESGGDTSTVHPQQDDATDRADAALAPESLFYARVARLAAVSGVGCDVFAVTGNPAAGEAPVLLPLMPVADGEEEAEDEPGTQRRRPWRRRSRAAPRVESAGDGAGAGAGAGAGVEAEARVAGAGDDEGGADPLLDAATVAARVPEDFAGRSKSPVPFVGLATLEPLATMTGGGVIRYDLTWRDDGRRLATDLGRCMAEPLAFQCMMRLRCSSGFDIASHPRKRAHLGAVGTAGAASGSTDAGNCWYGRGYGDEQVDNLWHLAVCTRTQALGCLFEFPSAAGFAGSPELAPTLQLSFVYSSLICKPGPSGEAVAEDGTDESKGDSATSGARWYIVRRLRLLTWQQRVAIRPVDMYRSAVEPVVLSLIMHQALHTITDVGSMIEARVLIRDWLVLLYAAYHSQVSHGADRLDLDFKACPALSQLPRRIYGLLRGPIFSLPPHESPTAAAAADANVESRCRVMGCSLADVVDGSYPYLESYENGSALGRGHLLLSNTAVVASGDPIVVGFALDRVVVYATAGTRVEFPPPATSAVSKRVRRWLVGATPSPRLVVVRGGTRGASVWFQSLLLNDPHPSRVQSRRSAGFSTAGLRAVARDGPGHVGDGHEAEVEDPGDFSYEGFELFADKAGKDAVRNLV